MKQFVTAFIIGFVVLGIVYLETGSSEKPRKKSDQPAPKISAPEQATTEVLLSLHWAGITNVPVEESPKGLAGILADDATANLGIELNKLFTEQKLFETEPVNQWPFSLASLFDAFPEKAFSIEMRKSNNNIACVMAVEGTNTITTSDHFSTSTEGNWTLVSSDHADELLAEIQAEIQASGTPYQSKSLFALKSDNVSELFQHLSLPALPNISTVTLSSSVHKGDLLIKGSADLLEAFSFEQEEWNIPVNTIRDPLVAFTAVQGFGRKILSLPALEDAQLEAANNQFYAWTVRLTPFTSYYALPIKDAANQIPAKADAFIASVNNSNPPLVLRNLQISKTDSMVHPGQMLPILIPFVRPALDPDYALAGFFPIKENNLMKPAPEALFDQVRKKPDLIYYDWELTLNRWESLKPTFQILSLVSTNPFKQLKAPFYQWLDAIGPKLGNTTTLASRTSDTSFKFERRAQLGLTAFELLTIARWLENRPLGEPISLVPFLPFGTMGGPSMHTMPQAPAIPAPPHDRKGQ